MRILLINDDGFWAPGLQQLYSTLCISHEVFIVAPKHEQSGCAHACTLDKPIRTEKMYLDGALIGYAVDGKPADCVKYALSMVYKEPPDLIISGINSGCNTGINILYSGTVAAALEGAIYGFPSMAVSHCTSRRQHLKAAVKITERLAENYFDLNIAKNIVLNVNIPAIPLEEMKGIMITRQGMYRYLDRFDRRTDPKQREYFWLVGEDEFKTNDPRDDEMAVRNGFISVTPISYELTAFNTFEDMKDMEADMRGSFLDLLKETPSTS